MNEQQNEKNHQQNDQNIRTFSIDKVAKFYEHAENLNKQRETYLLGSNRITTKKSPSILRTVSFVLILLLIKNANCQCVSKFVQDRIYVSDRRFCDMTFNDTCSEYIFAQCSQVICGANGQNCATQQGITSYNTCYSFCCQNLNHPQNNQNSLSYKFCYSQSSSSTVIPLGTILVAVCTTAFVGTIIFLCICRKFRNRNQQNIQNVNQINPPPPVSTAVDLNQYKVESQGPYFIDSKQACVICLDSKVSLRTHCGHYYHGSCLLAWLKKKPDNPCPLCMGIHYNPIKVFCTSCHYGDILVNIEHHTPQETVKNYDIHKCHNCNNLKQNSFSLNDENQSPPKSQNINEKFKKKQKVQFNQTHQHQLTKSKRRRRMYRHSSSQNNSSSQVQEINSQSLKNLKNNYGNSANLP